MRKKISSGLMPLFIGPFIPRPLSLSKELKLDLNPGTNESDEITRRIDKLLFLYKYQTRASAGTRGRTQN